MDTFTNESIGFTSQHTKSLTSSKSADKLAIYKVQMSRVKDGGTRFPSLELD